MASSTQNGTRLWKSSSTARPAASPNDATTSSTPSSEAQRAPHRRAIGARGVTVADGDDGAGGVVAGAGVIDGAGEVGVGEVIGAGGRGRSPGARRPRRRRLPRPGTLAGSGR